MKNNIKSAQRRKENKKSILENPALLILILFLFIYPVNPNSVNGQNLNCGTDSLFTVNQLREDFVIFRKALEEGHAGLYRYTSKEEFDKIFEETYQSLTKPITEMEFYLKLKPLIAEIHCGHTEMGFSTETNTCINTSEISIPFAFEFIGDKTYIVQNYSEIKDLTVGGEVVSINGNPIESILRRMLPLITADAHVQTSKFYHLKRANNFSRLYTLLYGQSTSFSIVYKSPLSQKEETLEVKGISRETMMKTAEERYPESFIKLPPLSKRYEDGIAILEIRTFVTSEYEEANISYPAFLNEAFNEFKENETKNLIIDLRNNGGGDDVNGRILTSYLLDKPFNYYRALEFKNISYDFLKYTDFPSEEWEPQVKNAKKNSNGWYDYTYHPNIGEQKILYPTFEGNVYILINGNSFSTTGETTSVIHFNKKAKFAGEECGAGYYGNNSGYMPTLTLPNSKMKVSIPLFRYTMDVEGYPADRGIIPDYPISRNIMDLVKGKDSEMEYLIKLIGQ